MAFKENTEQGPCASCRPHALWWPLNAPTSCRAPVGWWEWGWGSDKGGILLEAVSLGSQSLLITHPSTINQVITTLSSSL